VAGRRNQCSGEQAPAGMGRCLLSTVGVVAVEVGEKALEGFEEAFQARVLPLACARASEVVTHLRDHAQDVIAGVHGLLIADLSEAADGDGRWLGQGCERLGRLAGLQFAGQLDENGAVTGVEAPVVELVEMVLGEPLQQGAKVFRFACGQAFTHSQMMLPDSHLRRQLGQLAATIPAREPKIMGPPIYRSCRDPLAGHHRSTPVLSVAWRAVASWELPVAWLPRRLQAALIPAAVPVPEP
jgi:hypothetical protein